MSDGEIHVIDTGTVITLTVTDNDSPVDLSAATVKNLILKSPSGTILTKACTFVTDGTDGKLTYTTLVTDLSVEGAWQLQVYVELPGGKWHSDILIVRVYRNL